jgi:hypothetical protein
MVERNFGGRRVQIVGSYRRLDELSESLDKFSYRVLKKDCLDLPEKTFMRRTVELTDEQKKLYVCRTQRQNHEHDERNYTDDETTSDYLRSLQSR